MGKPSSLRYPAHAAAVAGLAEREESTVGSTAAFFLTGVSESKNSSKNKGPQIKPGFMVQHLHAQQQLGSAQSRAARVMARCSGQGQSQGHQQNF